MEVLYWYSTSDKMDIDSLQILQLLLEQKENQVWENHFVCKETIYYSENFQQLESLDSLQQKQFPQLLLHQLFQV